MSFFSSLSFKLPPSIKSFLTNNPIYRNDTARPILFAIGAAIIATKTLSLASSLFSLISIPKNLSTRYGKSSWAVITGASEGIGKAFALELASRGFNIVLISRTEEKLSKAAREIHNRCPEVQTKILVADFENSARDGFAEGIYEQVKDLDVSILVNNVGRGNFGSYMEVPIEKIRQIVLVNCLGTSLMTRVFLPHLSNRTQRSAIINVSSLAGVTPMPYYNPYGPSKVYTDYLSRGLAYEHSNIDILSVKPAGVSTAMNNFSKPNFRTLAPEEFVKATLGELGNTSHTYGHWKHKFQAWTARIMPEVIMRMYLEKRMRLKKERENREKQDNKDN